MMEIPLLMVMVVLIGRPFKFWHIKVLLLVIYTLNFDQFNQPTVYHEYFQNDLAYCPDCFSYQIEKCTGWLDGLEYDEDTESDSFLLSLPINIKREIQLVQLKSKPKYKYIGKYYGKNNYKLRGLQLRLTTEELTNIFIDKKRGDGLQFCPMSSIRRFVDILSARNTVLSELSVWLFLIVNAEPIMLPFLEVLGYPVPNTAGFCGFTTFQLFDGEPLEHYYDAPELLKIRIAQLLLEAAISFSKGSLGFQFYLTDLVPQKVIYSITTDKLYISGLDTLFIVDTLESHHPPDFNITHRHKYVECHDCFGFSPKEVCSHKMSDLNIFAACLFLREDFKKNRKHGFLAGLTYEILYPFPEFLTLLDMCVDCVDETCENRFKVGIFFSEYMRGILKHFGMLK